jgi:hypothetical protein
VERGSTGEDTIMFKNCCSKDDKGVDVIICQDAKSISRAGSRRLLRKTQCQVEEQNVLKDDKMTGYHYTDDKG